MDLGEAPDLYSAGSPPCPPLVVGGLPRDLGGWAGRCPHAQPTDLASQAGVGLPWGLSVSLLLDVAWKIETKMNRSLL